MSKGRRIARTSKHIKRKKKIRIKSKKNEEKRKIVYIIFYEEGAKVRSPPPLR